MWKFWKRKKERAAGQISNPVALAIVIAVIALSVSAGVMRWSWLLLDEQISLRQDLNDLKLKQTQIETQYEFWLNQLQEERKALKE